MFYGLKDEDMHTFKDALATLQRIYGRGFYADMLITFERNMGFAEDKKFMEALRKHAASGQDLSLSWRLHTLAWAAKHTLHIAGDFVECGVYKGFCTSVLADYLDFQGVEKDWYLYDTFEGIPEEHLTDHESQRRAGRMNEPGLHEMVQDKFKNYQNIKIIKESVPRSFEICAPEKIAFLHIDMNSASSEIAALESLFDRVSPSGIIIFDDYGWSSYRKQKEAEDPFMAERGYSILELPTGQGMVIKR